MLRHGLFNDRIRRDRQRLRYKRVSVSVESIDMTLLGQPCLAAVESRITVSPDCLCCLPARKRIQCFGEANHLAGYRRARM